MHKNAYFLNFVVAEKIFDLYIAHLAEGQLVTTRDTGAPLLERGF